MKQQEPSPWPPKMPQGEIHVDEVNGCTYVNGRKITSSWDMENMPMTGNTSCRKGNAPSR